LVNPALGIYQFPVFRDSDVKPFTDYPLQIFIDHSSLEDLYQFPFVDTSKEIAKQTPKAHDHPISRQPDLWLRAAMSN
jgi:hypothetical protein